MPGPPACCPLLVQDPLPPSPSLPAGIGMQRKERQASRRRLAARHLACCADGALPRHRTRTPRRAGAARARAAPRRTEASIRSHGQGGIRTHGTLAGTPVFETGRFNRSRTCPTPRRVDGETHRRVGVARPAVATRLPVSPSVRPAVTDRVGFEPTKRLPVYTLSRRVPSAARPPIHTTRRPDA